MWPSIWTAFPCVTTIQTTFIQSNTTHVYFNSINYPYMQVTCFGLYLGHPEACQYENRTKANMCVLLHWINVVTSLGCIPTVVFQVFAFRPICISGCPVVTFQQDVTGFDCTELMSFHEQCPRMQNTALCPHWDLYHPATCYMFWSITLTYF